MSIEEFNKTTFDINSKVIYNGKKYIIEAVDLEEGLIAIDEMGTFLDHGYETLNWKRCENIELIKN